MKHQIQLKRKLAATPEEVYEAWTDAELLGQWMIPIVGGRTVAHSDARVGGKYSIDMHGLSSLHQQAGEYLRLERPRLIEFTWNAGASPLSVVTVELKSIGGGETELTLTHRLLPSEESAQGHQKGWDSGLDTLAARFNRHYRKEIRFKASAAAVYAALATQEGLRGWWTQTCAVGGKTGDSARFEFGDIYKLMRIVTLTPERQVRWQVLESHIIAKGRDLPENEWAGTTIVFRINGDTPTNTVLRFDHLGLTPKLACHDLCRGGWDHFLASLQRYVETGAGNPHLASATECSSKAA